MLWVCNLQLSNLQRNVVGFEDANSTEMNENTSHPVIDLMKEQKEVNRKGGTMRLGAYDCTYYKRL